MPAPTPLTSTGRMSSAQPGSMPDTNTDVSPSRTRRSTASSSSARVRSPGGATGRTTSTRRWRPARRQARRSPERFVGPGVGGGGVDDRVDVVGERDRRCRRSRRRRAARCPPARRRRDPTLRRVRHDHPDQLEVAVRGDRPHRRSADVARPPHHHPVRHRRSLPTTEPSLLRDLLPPLAPPVRRRRGCGAWGASSTRSRRCSPGSTGSSRTAPRPTDGHAAPRSRRDDAVRSRASRRSPWVRDRG